MKQKVIYIIAIVAMLLLLILLIYGNFFVAPYITNIEKVESLQSENMVIINVNILFIIY